MSALPGRTPSGAAALATLLIGLGSGLASACSEAPRVDAPAEELSPEPQTPPNILLVVVDTLRGDMVAVPERIADTPGLDALASDGVAFTQCFSHAPMTLPAHAALFSSRAPFETGVLANWQRVPGELPLLPEWLGSQGYATHAVVSLATLDPREGQVALDRGFDSYDRDYWQIDHAPSVLVRLKSTVEALDPERPFFLFAHFSDPHSPYDDYTATPATAQVLFDGAPTASLNISRTTHWEHDLALDRGRHTIEVRSERPFKLNRFEWEAPGRELEPRWEEGQIRRATTRAFISVEVEQPTASHLRLLAHENEPRMPAARERYIREVEQVDRYIGQLLDELRARDLYDDTLIVFTSDHGEALGEHGELGHVRNVHDEMLHVPLVIKPPAGSPETAALRQARARLVPHQDIAPTLLELAGLPPLPGARGRSLLSPRQPLLLAQTHQPVAPQTFLCLRDEAYKLIYSPDDGTFQMYDLVADPGEEQDVFAERRGEREPWVERLRDIAGRAAKGVMQEEEISAEGREMLDALGYGR